MLYLIAGLLIFLGVHSLRIFAEGWRSRSVARMGAMPYKGAYTVVSLLGFGLIVWGFGLARDNPVQCWAPPQFLRHPAILLTLVAFVLLAAAYVPHNAIKARLHHPMLLGTKVWAFAHLLVNGNLAHLVLFGSFLFWAVLCFAASRRRDRALGTVYAPGNARGTTLAVLSGVGAWLLFAFFLHGWLIGVRPIV